ncbi:MAG: hypothetical protein LKF31_08605 [Muribaculaceae bacterium]|jgi:hypothetical protein|nr:hypothetical protein [Muribaculaceae bacterium]
MIRISKAIFVMLTAAQLLTASAQNLQDGFANPPIQSRPYVWWHWMGSNFSLNGITKDLEAMHSSGIGGATIFNLASAVQETQSPTLNNPWPEQTYRSPAYWKAIAFACKEAERLGMAIGLENNVGYSATGGPWIDEDKGMKHLVSREVKIVGGKKLAIDIPRPELPPYRGWGASGKTVPDKYDEIAVLAVPVGNDADGGKTVDLSKAYNKEGKIAWNAPKGNCAIFRIGYASTMSCPHPVPDELIGKTMEVNKIDAEFTNFHWDNVLNPLKKNIGQYFGKSFKYICIDSYEAGEQNWSRNFKNDFISIKGYDPTIWLPYVVANEKDSLATDENKVKRFKFDFNDVISQLYQKNGWGIACDRVASMGLELDHEPYSGPFSTVAGAASADVPMGEFWTDGSGMIQSGVPAGGRAAGHRIIGAEAFSSTPQNSRWTEDPAMLKKTAEGAFASGVNRLYLHQWVHQPFDDRYQPGMCMGWWGTHFSRFQPWLKLGKAFFDYLGRCQFLLQQGEQVIDFLAVDEDVDRITDAIVPTDFLTKKIEVKDGDVVLYSGRRYKIVQFPKSTAMLPEVLDKLEWLVEQGATVVAQKPVASPSLTDYPKCDDVVKSKAEQIWSKYEGKRIFASREEAMNAIRLAPDYKMLKGDAAVVHRHSTDGEIYYVGNLTDKPQTLTLSLRINGMLPELWNAETGENGTLENWNEQDGRTLVQLDLLPYQSRFIVMRRKATREEIAEGARAKVPLIKGDSIIVSGKWQVHFEPKLDNAFNMTLDSLQDFSQSSASNVKYFTGTATYNKEVNISGKQMKSSKIILNLGEMNDIAELRINGVNVGVLWYPPYEIDVTKFLKKGKNKVSIAVTDNWANRMIGDEQYPADFKWGNDRGENMGRALLAYPDWLVKGTPRPERNRKTFGIWYYYRKDSKLQKAGLDGPVRLEFWEHDLTDKQLNK